MAGQDSLGEVFMLFCLSKLFYCCFSEWTSKSEPKLLAFDMKTLIPPNTGNRGFWMGVIDGWQLLSNTVLPYEPSDTQTLGPKSTCEQCPSESII